MIINFETGLCQSMCNMTSVSGRIDFEYISYIAGLYMHSRLNIPRGGLDRTRVKADIWIYGSFVHAELHEELLSSISLFRISLFGETLVMLWSCTDPFQTRGRFSDCGDKHLRINSCKLSYECSSSFIILLLSINANKLQLLANITAELHLPFRWNLDFVWGVSAEKLNQKLAEYCRDEEKM